METDDAKWLGVGIAWGTVVLAAGVILAVTVGLLL